MGYLAAVRDARAKYVSTKKPSIERRQSWVLHWVLRPISFWLAPLFIRSGVSANNVTGLSWAGVVTGAVAYGIGGPIFIPVAGLIYFFNYMLDLIDGAIARHYDHRSYYGNYLDALGDTIRLPFNCLGLTVGLHRHSQDYALLPSGLLESHDWVLLTIGSLTASLVLVRKYAQVRLDRNALVVSQQKVHNASAGLTVVGPTSTKPHAGLARKAANVWVKMSSATDRLFLELQVPLWFFLSLVNLADLLFIWIVITMIVSSSLAIGSYVLHARDTIDYPRP